VFIHPFSLFEDNVFGSAPSLKLVFQVPISCEDKPSLGAKCTQMPKHICGQYGSSPSRNCIHVMATKFSYNFTCLMSLWRPSSAI